MNKTILGLGLLGTVAGASIVASPALAKDNAQTEIIGLSRESQTPARAIALAHRQEAAGNSLGAASTLERALLDHPDADNVRLVYVAVLCRLDDRQSARVELEALQGRPTGAAEWSEMLKACGKSFASNAHHSGRINGSVSLGLAYDDDAFANLLDGNVYYEPPKIDGWGVISSGNLNARVDAGSGFFYGTIQAQSHDDISGPANDYQFSELRAGYGLESEDSREMAGLVYRYGRVAGSSYLNEYGVQARFDRRVGSYSWVSVLGEITRKEIPVPMYYYTNLDGQHFELGVKFVTHPAPDKAFEIGITGEARTAPQTYDEYYAMRLMAALRWPLGQHGTYLSASSTARYVQYRTPDSYPAIKEWRLYNRVAVGTPLGIRNLFGEAAVTYSVRDYRPALFYFQNYNNVGGEFRLIYRF